MKDLYVVQYGCIDLEEEVFTCLTNNITGCVEYYKQFFHKSATDCDMENFDVLVVEQNNDTLVELKDEYDRIIEWFRISPGKIMSFKSTS